jgi:hypothetical protein
MKAFIFLLFFTPLSISGQCLFNNGGADFTDGAAGFTDIQGVCKKENTPLSISVYPNPTTDILTIEGKEKEGRVNVFDVAGRKVLETTNSVLDFFSFTQGIYFLHIEKQVFKIVKQ